MSENKEELIKAQNELIGILFEIIKRLHAKNDLDTEYFQIIGNNSHSDKDSSRLSDGLGAQTGVEYYWHDSRV